MEKKRLQSNFTTPEQAKRLLELGVPEWAADCVTSRYGGSTFFVQECQLLRRCIDSNNYIPCWSVGRLMEIIRICNLTAEKPWVYIERDNIHAMITAITDGVNNRMLDFSKLG